MEDAVATTTTAVAFAVPPRERKRGTKSSAPDDDTAGTSAAEAEAPPPKPKRAPSKRAPKAGAKAVEGPTDGGDEEPCRKVAVVEATLTLPAEEDALQPATVQKPKRAAPRASKKRAANDASPEAVPANEVPSSETKCADLRSAPAAAEDHRTKHPNDSTTCRVDAAGIDEEDTVMCDADTAASAPEGPMNSGQQTADVWAVADCYANAGIAAPARPNVPAPVEHSTALAVLNSADAKPASTVAAEIRRLRRLLQSHPHLRTVDLCLQWTLRAQSALQMLADAAAAPMARVLAMIGVPAETVLYDAETCEFDNGE